MASHRSRPPWLIPAGVAIVAVVLLAVAAFDRGGDPEIDSAPPVASNPAMSVPAGTDTATTVDAAATADTANATPAPVDSAATATADEWPARRIPDDEYALGALDAPVVLVEYADFQCGFCTRFHRETLPLLQERYIETGLVRFEWRDLPFLGNESYEAAYAARAAGEQGRFWDFYDTVYRVDPDDNDLSDGGLTEIATDLGLDIERFNADRDDQRVRNEVLVNLGEATSIGFNSTPSFVVNKRAIIGAQPYEVFQQVLDEALAEVGVTPPPPVSSPATSTVVSSAVSSTSGP